MVCIWRMKRKLNRKMTEMGGRPAVENVGGSVEGEDKTEGVRGRGR